MCPPTHFDVTYSINPWMRPTLGVNKRLATSQWETLAALYESLGLQIELVTPEPDLPDMVFTANAAYVEGTYALLANFRHKERRPEEDYFCDWFREHGYTVHDARHRFEGAGDAINVGDKIYFGYGFRSDYSMRSKLHKMTGKPVVSLLLVNDHFYHLDTCFSTLSPTTALIYTGAFGASGLDELCENFEVVYAVPRDDAFELGLNSVKIGQHLIVDYRAEEVATFAESRGFTVHPIDLDEFKKSGGGAFCMTLFI